MRPLLALTTLTLALACGRTEPVEGLETTGLGGGAGGGGVEPAPNCPPANGRLVKLGQAAHPTVSGLEVRGNDLYVSSHLPFIPMLYRRLGTVERFPRCGGEATWKVTDLDRATSLVVTSQFVHWRSFDHDSGGTNRKNFVMTRARDGSGPVERVLTGGDALSNVVRSAGELRWVREQRRDQVNEHVLEASDESASAVRTLGRFTSNEKAGPGRLFALDDGRLVQVIRTVNGSLVNVIAADFGSRLTLFTLEQVAEPIAIIDGDWLLYTSSRNNTVFVAKRRLVTQVAETRLYGELPHVTGVGAVLGRFVYLAQGDQTFFRVPLDGMGGEKVDLGLSGGQPFQVMQALDGKIFFATGQEGITAPQATLWVFTP